MPYPGHSALRSSSASRSKYPAAVPGSTGPVRRPVSGQRQHAHAHVCLALPGGLSPSLRPRPPPPGVAMGGWVGTEAPVRATGEGTRPAARPRPAGSRAQQPRSQPPPYSARVAPQPAGAARARRPGRRYLIDGQLHGVAERLQQGGARGAAGGGHGRASALRPPARSGQSPLALSRATPRMGMQRRARPSAARGRSRRARGGAAGGASWPRPLCGAPPTRPRRVPPHAARPLDFQQLPAPPPHLAHSHARQPRGPIAERRPDSRSQSEDACLAAPLLRAENAGEGLRLARGCRPRATESRARRWGRAKAAACLRLCSLPVSGMVGAVPTPPWQRRWTTKGLGVAARQRGGTWRDAALEEVENKARGLGAAGRRATRTPKQKMPFVSRAAQSCGDPGGLPRPRPDLGPTGCAGTTPAPRIQHSAKQVGPGQRPRERKPGQPAAGIKGPASSEERLLLVSIPSCR